LRKQTQKPRTCFDFARAYLRQLLHRMSYPFIRSNFGS
jgi:hypothetical protein